MSLTTEFRVKTQHIYRQCFICSRKIIKSSLLGLFSVFQQTLITNTSSQNRIIHASSQMQAQIFSIFSHVYWIKVKTSCFTESKHKIANETWSRSRMTVTDIHANRVHLLICELKHRWYCIQWKSKIKQKSIWNRAQMEFIKSLQLQYLTKDVTKTR